MTDTTIVVPSEGKVGSPLSWSAAIAGALAAIAVTFLIIALGSGIGLSFASPYSSGPSVKSMTILAAVWLAGDGRDPGICHWRLSRRPFAQPGV
jgi:hypothetical protein